MKKSVLLLLFALIGSLSIAQTAQATFNNTTATYFVGTFFTIPISGNCPTTALTTFYHDIPNNYSYTGFLINESGSSIANITSVSGITIKKWPSGASYPITFCSGGTPASTGFTSIPEPNGNGNPFTIVTWNINTGTNTVLVSFF